METEPASKTCFFTKGQGFRPSVCCMESGVLVIVKMKNVAA